MIKPAINWREMRQISRTIGAILVLVAGLVLVIQAFATDILPPADGFLETQALIINKEQVGTFQDPAFSITLSYSVTNMEGVLEERRSGQRIAFEAYRVLNIGDTVKIHYSPQNSFNWRLASNFSGIALDDYALGVLMLVFALFSLFFPLIVRWASREEDFQYTEETLSPH